MQSCLRREKESAMKTCRQCGLQKPLTAFHKRAAAKDGLRSGCKECDRKAGKAYREEHHKEQRAHEACYRVEHSEERCAYAARYRAEHSEELCVRAARYRKEHPEEIRASAARWRKAHPEIRRMDERRRRAQKQTVSERFTPEMEQFVKAAWHNRCALCASTKKLCIDHWRPLSQGYALTMGNAVLLCRYCNSGKHDKLPEDLGDQVRVAAIEQRLVTQAERWEW